VSETDATMLRPREEPDYPRIPGYDIQQVLGRGGMAVVYLARDINLMRLVAVKTVIEAYVEDEEFRRRFQDEAHTVAGFRHPNVVTVFASGEVDGKKYIVMEYVAGGTLNEKLSDGALPEPDAARVAEMMADALAYSHAHGIIHRDFKPGNILFTADNVPVLSDFGVAKSSTGDNSKTVVGMVIGAPLYMAPEQARGLHIDEKIDIYALGLVFYQMLTGHLPDRAFAPVKSAAERKALAKSLPKDARHHADLIARCLAFEPGDRPTATECKKILEGRPRTTSDQAARRRRPALATLSVALAIAAIGTWFALRTDPGADSSGATTAAGAASTAAPAARASAVTLLPPSARMFSNGQPIDGAALDPATLPALLAVTAPGYVGQAIVGARDLSWSPLTLAPLDLPSKQEHDLFLRTFFGSEPAVFDPREVRQPALRQALELQAASLKGDTQRVADLSAQLEALALAGDSGARVVRYLATERSLLSLPRAEALEGLRQAMDAGYGLATYYYAMHLKDTAGSQMTEESAAYREFESTLQRAYDQGLVEIVDAQRRNIVYGSG
jgi:predicted Ser/Thr protein kinase